MKQIDNNKWLQINNFPSQVITSTTSYLRLLIHSTSWKEYCSKEKRSTVPTPPEQSKTKSIYHFLNPHWINKAWLEDIHLRTAKMTRLACICGSAQTYGQRSVCLIEIGYLLCNNCVAFLSFEDPVHQLVIEVPEWSRVYKSIELQRTPKFQAQNGYVTIKPRNHYLWP